MQLISLNIYHYAFCNNFKETNVEMQIEKDTASSMATLEKIDRIKTELQTAKQGLHEADNWTVLANDVEEVFESSTRLLRDNCRI